ncbi:MAG: LacI family transcriptional regulator [Alicyclobacillus sp.]|nr:LacI family transcriptional regulator [Alicyclobacillus sp.]
MSATIYDVAKHAGVSVATVSRVLNNAPGVRPETKDKVLRAIDLLQYQYNHNAGALATGRTGTIGLLVPNISHPFYSEVADGVYSEALQQGVDVVTFNLLSQPEPNFKLLSRRAVDGLLAMDMPKSALGKLATMVGNLVLIGNDFLDGKTSCVVTDNYSATELLMQHFFDHGHRRVAMLTEPPMYNDIRERISCYSSKMEEEGLGQYREIVPCTGASMADGEKVGREWIQRGLKHTAVFASNDMLAIGFMRALRSEGIRVPEDVSVAGFDGTWVASIVDPPLTTVSQPVHDMGSLALRLLLELLESDRASPRKVVLNPSLTIGGTVARVPVNLHA